LTIKFFVAAGNRACSLFYQKVKGIPCMKKEKFCFWLSTLFLAILVLFVKPVALAAETGEGNVGFDIQMVPSDAQLDKNKSYFDLRLNPKEQKTIAVQVNNTSSEESTFDIQVNQAYTNTQGFIDYKDVAEVNKNDYPINLQDIVTYPKEITLKANESTTFSIDIKMPSQSFDGQLMAGIQVNKRLDTTENSITNRYGYILGLTITETDKAVERQVKLNSIKTEVTFGQPTVVANIENPTMDAIGHLIYKAKITEKDSGKTILEKEYDSGMQLAPNSIYPFAIEFGNQRMIAGDYVLSLNISDAKENHWDFKKEFTITDASASDINQATVDQGKESSWLWLILLLAGVLVLIIGVLSYLLWRKKKRS
jgi:hypothetical protein